MSHSLVLCCGADAKDTKLSGDPRWDLICALTVKRYGATIKFCKTREKFLWHLLECVVIDGFMETPIQEFYK